ncbi:olfactory receptor 198-like protein [Camelus ferus]|nr:olfactory receptor 198-like protein [Camelus ferus]
MMEANKTLVTEFVLTRLSDLPGLQVPLFLVFLGIYLTTMMGNLGLIFLIWKDPHLHTPMYFFLGSLAFADACSSSSVTPKMLMNFLSKDHTISMVECIAQFYFFASSATTECFLLVLMAYDRYVAIRKPLLYPVVMSTRLCTWLISVSSDMAEENKTLVTEFVLTRLSDLPGLQVPLFLVFLGIYLTTMMGNLGLIFLIWKDPHLHTPMYFFLGSLAFADACSSSSVTPKMLMNFLSKDHTISMVECIAQFYFFASSATTECFLLVVMAYDRYVAIWNPLLYPVVMSTRLCIQFIGVSYFICFLHSAIHVAFIQVFTFMTIMVSYTHVLFAILKKKSENGMSKAFSTCSAHLLSVSLFYGTLFFIVFIIFLVWSSV